ncbi:MAG: DUF3865 domain-containing protein [Holosporales bacterium]
MDYIAHLNREMLEDYSAVNAKTNPVAQQLGGLSVEQLDHILSQYSLFSKNITTFLLKAFYELKHSQFESLAAELIQNISEELSLDEESKDKNRLPHYVLLRQGFLEVGHDIGAVRPSKGTARFIHDMLETMESTSPAYVAGACYALESSAVPELDMAYTFVEKFFAFLGVDVPQKVKLFFSSHVNEIEIGHEARLKEVCEASFKDDLSISQFKSGFASVMQIMDRWWVDLLSESQVTAQKAA